MTELGASEIDSQRWQHLACRNEKIDWWENVYGFDMRCIRDIAIAEPLVDNVNQDQICTEVYRLLTLDIMSMHKTAASFKVCLSDWLHLLTDLLPSFGLWRWECASVLCWMYHLNTLSTIIRESLSLLVLGWSAGRLQLGGNTQWLHTCLSSMVRCFLHSLPQAARLQHFSSVSSHSVGLQSEIVSFAPHLLRCTLPLCHALMSIDIDML